MVVNLLRKAGTFRVLPSPALGRLGPSESFRVPRSEGRVPPSPSESFRVPGSESRVLPSPGLRTESEDCPERHKAWHG